MRSERSEPDFSRMIGRVLALVRVCLLLIAGMCGLFFYFSRLPATHAPPEIESVKVVAASHAVDDPLWQAPDSTAIPLTEEGDLIRYGRELIAHTSRYLGPQGKVRPISNGMNCQNCHLKAGTKPFGNNYAAVASTYPKFRARSGSIETMEKRINDCIERSLNGKPLEHNSREMHAIIAWFQWLGKDVEKGSVPRGTGLTPLPLLERAASPAKGKAVYKQHCQVCHGMRAEGFKHPDSVEWTYPPLAGMQSYNTGAGLFRLSRFAGYVKSNMPHGTTFENPVLTDEEAWDVAAYVNSLPRPEKHFAEDWPDIAAKPFDHPFGPYADAFSETQHKYGPFVVIQAESKKTLTARAK